MVGGWIIRTGRAGHAAVATGPGGPGDARHVDPHARLLRGGGDTHGRPHGGVSELLLSSPSRAAGIAADSAAVVATF